MAEIALWAASAVTNTLTAVGVPAAIATPLATVAVNAGLAAAGNAVAGCCAPSRAEGPGEWLEEAA